MQMLQKSSFGAVSTTSRGNTTSVPCIPHMNTCSRLVSQASTSSNAPFTSSSVPPRPQVSVSKRGLNRTCATAGEQATPAVASTPDRRKGRNSYRPDSFQEMVADATNCVLDAIADGHKRLEVEFPPLPVSIDGYKGSSDLFIDANTQLAIGGAKRIAASGRKVHVLMPDEGEYQRSYKLFKTTLDMIPGVTMGHLNEAGGGGMLAAWQGFLGGGAPPSAEAGKAADVHILINATCVELINVQRYVEALPSTSTAVLWNLELDTLRGDLGLLGLPSKDVQYKFLSYFLPVFFLRTRDYSKGVAVAPFLVNYSGALFREYPGPWQVLLKQDNGIYAVIAEDRSRYNLGEVKVELMTAMGLATEADGSLEKVFRQGLKNSTWYEDDYDLEASHVWRL